MLETAEDAQLDGLVSTRDETLTLLKEKFGAPASSVHNPDFRVGLERMKQSNPNLSMQTADTHVLVVGAGMAGLSAARVLAERGYRVLVLEAQNRIGGRIFTKRVGGEVIELGAEFVHGRPPELVALIEEAGLTLVERTGSWVRNVGADLWLTVARRKSMSPRARKIPSLFLKSWKIGSNRI